MNKNYFLVIITIFLGQDCLAQMEFAPLGSRWIINNAYSLEDGQKPLESFKTYESEKDTVISSLNFRKVGPWLFHQDEHHVYYLYNDSLRLIYNFEAQLNDTLTFDMFTCKGGIVKSQFQVTKIDTVQFGQENLQRFTCLSLNQYLEFDNQKYTYIEKIGSERYLVEDLVGCSFIPGAEPDILRCFHEGSDEYQTDWFKKFGVSNCELITHTIDIEEDNSITIYPNPTEGQVSIKVDNVLASELIIHNTSGQIVQSQNLSSNSIFKTCLKSNGLYFLRIITEDNKILTSRKIIVH